MKSSLLYYGYSNYKNSALIVRVYIENSYGAWWE